MSKSTGVLGFIHDAEVYDDISAVNLSGGHIDQLVSFDWRLAQSGIAAHAVGAIREIHHDGEGVTSWLAPTDRDDDDCKAEFMVAPDAMIRILR